MLCPNIHVHMKLVEVVVLCARVMTCQVVLPSMSVDIFIERIVIFFSKISSL